MGKADEMKIIPYVIALWFRYLLGIDDKGETMQLSPDPMLDVLTSALSGIKLGKQDVDMSGFNWILSSVELFGINLLETDDMGDKIKKHFRDMLEGPGAVRKSLKELLASQ